MDADAETEERIGEVLRTRLQKEAATFSKIKGGRNSQVFRVDCRDRSVVAVKSYFRSRNDSRDRMGCEFRALQFLRSAGVRTVASPLAIDQDEQVAVYEFLPGQPATGVEAGPAEIDQFLDFLRSLRQLALGGTARNFPPASEACFSVDAIFASVDGRARRLQKAAAEYPVLADYLQREFDPTRAAIEQWCRKFCEDNGIDPQAEIPLEARTLSPSDFGLHNTLRDAHGRLAFVDFEYFGWDDPAKTIADFVLHPGMQLSRELKQRFFAGALSVFANVSKIEARTRAVYPLFGLKWCTILLNEFTLDHMERRRFADAASGAWSQTVQLEKARRTLAQTMDDHQDFPYHS